MNSYEDARFRLDLARGYLARAESDAREKKWDGCLANAQEAVENAGKSILAHFRPTPQTHDVIDPLEKLLKLDAVPRTIKQQLNAALDDFRNMGIKMHIRATYGDESTRTPPWKLIQEREASEGLGKARRATALAETVFTEMTGSPDQKS
ncbi:MAG: HEPN domain-containing protein [Chloroflexi bacterium]|nr:HEPN domain-containing protein [Chloroflexota bacterium]